MLRYHNTLWWLCTLFLISIHLLVKSSALLNCTCGKPGISSSRIVNGIEAYRNEFPWIVAFRMKKKSPSQVPRTPFCAGSLISDRFVLTAAHCLAKMKNQQQWSKVELVLGLLLVRSTPPEMQVRDIAKAVMTMQYKKEQKDYDVAIIEMDRPAKITDTIYPICLPYDIAFPEEEPWVMAAGWGKTSYFTKQSEKLMKSRWMELMPFNECKQKTKFKYRNYPMNDRMVCGVSDRTDACIGDSGGPLMHYSSKYFRWFLVGITSFGFGCNQPNDPGVYTNLFHRGILDWVTCANTGQLCQA